MPVQAHFVAAIGRVSVSDISARPKIEAIVAKHGGRIVPGGLGNSNDPIKADFGDNKEAASAAAKEAWFLDDVESAYVRDSAGAEAGSAAGVKEGTEVPDEKTGDSVLESALEAVNEGADVKEVVDALIEGKKVEKKEKAKDKDDADDKKKMEEGQTEESLDEAVNRFGHKLIKDMKVKVAHPRGGSYDDEIHSFQKASDFSKAYGKQVNLKSGRSAAVDDLIPA